MDTTVNTERKLATIRRISKILPHSNADLLEIAIVDGWRSVVTKGKHIEGELIVYFEIDSVLPVREEFEFLRKCCYIKRDWIEGGEGFRLKTARFRKELSQGLVVPISKELEIEFSHTFLNFEGARSLQVGDDVTSILGVTKWDPPISACLSGLARGNFPSFIKRTDQERIQNCWTKFKELYAGLEFEVTTKLDGSSCSIYHYDGNVGVCSRNLDLKLEGNDGNSYIQVANKYNLLEGLKLIGDNIAIQGEVCGPGIQGNKEQLNEVDLFVFDIYLIDDQRHATPSERNLLLSKLETVAGIVVKQVPSIRTVTLDQFGSIEDILVHAEGPSLNSPVREGDVYKAVVVVNGQVPSFKVISNKWLLENKE